MKSVLRVVALLASTALVRADTSRLHIARVELRGPLSSVTFDLAVAGRTHVELDLRAGESRVLDVPLPVFEGLDERAPKIESAPADGFVHFVGWDPDRERTSAFERVPLGLKTRPRPAVERDLALSPASFLLAAAASLFAQRVKKRVLRALAVALVASIAILWIETRDRTSDVERTRLIEVDASSGSAITIDTASERIELELAHFLALELDPPKSVPEVELDARAPGAARLSISSPNATLHAIGELGAPPAIERGSNRFADLDSVWLREGDGSWSSRGVWPVGAPLPAPVAGDRSLPPGWINPALPQGISVLIARRKVAAGGPSEWIRSFGF